MKTYNVIIYDHTNKLFDKMIFISGEMEELITQNIYELQQLEMNVNMQSISDEYSTTNIEKRGFTNKKGLYEILILRYNNNGGKILKKFI